MQDNSLFQQPSRFSTDIVSAEYTVKSDTPIEWKKVDLSNIKVPTVQHSGGKVVINNDGECNAVYPKPKQPWISPAWERAGTITKHNNDVHGEEMKDGKTYLEWTEEQAVANYQELADYLATLKDAVENIPEGDNRWIIVSAKNSPPLDMNAIDGILRNAPEDAGILHLSGKNKFGGFGELPVDAGEEYPQLVKPMRFNGGATATAYKPDTLRAMVAALETNMQQEAEHTSEEKAIGGISPLDHIFTLMQRASLRIPEDDAAYPEYKAVKTAFKDALGKEAQSGVYAANIPPNQVVQPVSRTTAVAIRNILHPLQMDGKSKAITLTDPLVERCIAPKEEQKGLSPASLQRAVEHIGSIFQQPKEKAAEQADQIKGIVNAFLEQASSEETLLSNLNGVARHNRAPSQRAAGM